MYSLFKDVEEEESVTSKAIPFHATSSCCVCYCVFSGQALDVQVQKKKRPPNGSIKRGPNDRPIPNSSPTKTGKVLLDMLCFGLPGPTQTCRSHSFEKVEHSRRELHALHRKKPFIPCATIPRRRKSTLDHLCTPVLFRDSDVSGGDEEVDNEYFSSSKKSKAPSSCPSSAAILRSPSHLPAPSTAECTDLTDLRDDSEACRLICGPLVDLGRSAAAATGVGEEDESSRDEVLVPMPDPVPDRPNCHALGLLVIRMRRRGLRRFCGLSRMFVGLLLQALMVEEAQSRSSSMADRNILPSSL